MTKQEATEWLADFSNSKISQERMIHSLNVFARICTANALLRGFHEDERTIRESLMQDTPQLAWFDSAVLQAELARQASEIGEAVEAVRKPGPDHHCPEFSNFLIEEADVLIRVGDTVGKRDLPIGEAVVAKLLVNATRSWKHEKNS
jgi:hypothetical protein